MKRYICFKCIAFGGKSPCVLACENDLEPTHCPHDDSKYPNAYWELDASQHSVEAERPNCPYVGQVCVMFKPKKKE